MSYGCFWFVFILRKSKIAQEKKDKRIREKHPELEEERTNCLFCHTLSRCFVRVPSVEIRDNEALASISSSKRRRCAASQGKTGLDNSPV